MLSQGRVLPIDSNTPTKFDHAAYDPATGRVFLAHTARDRLVVVDAERGAVVAELENHPEAAGVVAVDGTVAVTNRGDGTLSVVDAASLHEVKRLAVGVRPNGVALTSEGIGVAGDLGDDSVAPGLVCFDLESGAISRVTTPGRPKWCVIGANSRIAYCAIEAPSLVMVVDVREAVVMERWPLPSLGAHGIDLDADRGRLYVACDGRELLELAIETGLVQRRWQLPGVPDATFFSPRTGLVHVAVGDPGMVATVNLTGPDGVSITPTGRGAKTTALLPGRLFAFRPETGDALELIEPENL